MLLFTHCSYSEEDGADTADSLDIKPPQAVVRHRKTTSLHRRDKHPQHSGNSRDDKERINSKSSSRHYGVDRDDNSSGKHSRHRRHGETDEKMSRRLDSDKRERDSSRHDRKERNPGDRVLEDLRER